MKPSARGLVILDHGSRRPEAHEHLERIAQDVRARRTDLTVAIAHMELASPSLAEALDRCVAAGAREVWVHPFFLVPGRHLSTDIPAQLAAEAKRHPGVSVQLTSALGMSAGIADLVLSTVPLAQG